MMISPGIEVLVGIRLGSLQLISTRGKTVHYTGFWQATAGFSRILWFGSLRVVYSTKLTALRQRVRWYVMVNQSPEGAGGGPAAPSQLHVSSASDWSKYFLAFNFLIP